MPTQYHDFRFVLPSNSTATSHAEKEVRLSAPDSPAIDMSPYGTGGFASAQMVPSYVQILPFGVGSSDQAFGLRIWGWTKVVGAEIYVPQLLADWQCTLGSTSGCDATGLQSGSGILLCDTIVETVGAGSGPFSSLISSAAEMAASGLVHIRGCRWLDISITRGSATSANALYRPVDA